jgi:pimeloyl-ACP methyl ester carboxylesterase
MPDGGRLGWAAEVIENYRRGAGDLGAVLRAPGMARAREPETIAPLLDQIRVPVQLLIGGAPRGSGVPRPQFALFRARVPQLVVDTVRGAGLRIHEEQPGVVVKAVLAMAEQLRGIGPESQGAGPTTMR